MNDTTPNPFKEDPNTRWFTAVAQLRDLFINTTFEGVKLQLGNAGCSIAEDPIVGHRYITWKLADTEGNDCTLELWHEPDTRPGPGSATPKFEGAFAFIIRRDDGDANAPTCSGEAPYHTYASPMECASMVVNNIAKDPAWAKLQHFEA